MQSGAAQPLSTISPDAGFEPSTRYLSKTTFCAPVAAFTSGMAAAVLPPPLAKICELEAENARLMRDLHRMLSDTTDGPDREYKRRKIDTNGEEVYIVRFGLFLFAACSNESTQGFPGSSHDALARPSPLTVSDSPCTPSVFASLRPRHSPHVRVHQPPFSLDPALHLPDARPHPDSPRYGHHGDRDHAHAHGAPLSQPHAAHTHTHKVVRDHGHGHGYTLAPFKFSHPHSPVDINGRTHEHDVHEYDRQLALALRDRAHRGWGRRWGAVVPCVPLRVDVASRASGCFPPFLEVLASLRGRIAYSSHCRWGFPGPPKAAFAGLPRRHPPSKIPQADLPLTSKPQDPILKAHPPGYLSL
ncbi:hypothetical protein B0H13DRAFT_2336913 [Mycena leptocephala]|nr:hypothetical protein B0H13DRAFT_2336913 [Mycena leptocephala]